MKTKDIDKLVRTLGDALGLLLELNPHEPGTLPGMCKSLVNREIELHDRSNQPYSVDWVLVAQARVAIAQAERRITPVSDLHTEAAEVPFMSAFTMGGQEVTPKPIAEGPESEEPASEQPTPDVVEQKTCGHKASCVCLGCCRQLIAEGKCLARD